MTRVLFWLLKWVLMKINPLELHLKNFYVSLPQDSNLTKIQSVDPGNFYVFFFLQDGFKVNIWRIQMTQFSFKEWYFKKTPFESKSEWANL